MAHTLWTEMGLSPSLTTSSPQREELSEHYHINLSLQDKLKSLQFVTIKSEPLFKLIVEINVSF